MTLQTMRSRVRLVKASQGRSSAVTVTPAADTVRHRSTDAAWLTTYRDQLRRDIATIARIDAGKIERDITARRLDVKLAQHYVRNRNRLIRELDKSGITEAEWCRTLGRGHSLKHMLRRIQLLKGFDAYVRRRREVGENGCYSLEYAVYLCKDSATRSLPTRIRLPAGTIDPMRHRLTTGDAIHAMRKLPSASVHVAISSPPYWPARRDYGSKLGFEPTLAGYIAHLVEIYAEVWRMLRNDGVCWVVIDDAISQPAKRYVQQTDQPSGKPGRLPRRTFPKSQDTTYLCPAGNWLGIPDKFADAMRNSGWFFRDRIIWDKGSLGRKDSSETRTRHSFETVFMFTKKATGYYYDQDALRIPLVSEPVYSVKSSSTLRHDRPGVLRFGRDRDHRVAANPLGRIADAVWHIPPTGYAGLQSAPFPQALVRNCLLLTAPPSAVVLDLFGGSGTVSVVAKEMGLSSVYIDANPAFRREARQRLLMTKTDESGANDDEPMRLAGD